MTHNLAVCIGCGCNDMDACDGGCHWVRVDAQLQIGVCSECHDHVDRWDEGDRQLTNTAQDYNDMVEELDFED